MIIGSYAVPKVNPDIFTGIYIILYLFKYKDEQKVKTNISINI